MRALYIIVPVLCILVIAYRYYSAFIAAKLWALDDTRVTPAHAKSDGANFFPTTRWVLFGHHFAAIAGAGPLDRKSTRLNSSHTVISYAVFCLKKKNKYNNP